MKNKIGNKNVIFGIVLITIIISLSFAFYGYENTWQLWNVPPVHNTEADSSYTSFADLRSITCGAESKSLGYDPMVVNPCDPRQRQLNYPRIWQTLYWFGLDDSHTIYMGITIILFYLAGVFIFFYQRLNIKQSVLVLFAIFSPAAMLAFERGNIDMFMFFLVSLAIYFFGRNRTLMKYFSFLTILIAFLLKLFPIFSIAIFFREKKNFFLKSILSMGLLAILYVLITYSDLLLISKYTPKEVGLSYGINVLWMAVSRLNASLGGIVHILSYVMIVFAIVFAYFGLRKQSDDSIVLSNKAIDGFRAGAAIYLGTFIIGNNYDYRLIFLLLTLPQIMLMIKTQSGITSLVLKITLISIMISLWHLVLPCILSFTGLTIVPDILIDEIANWLVFFGLMYLFGLTAPKWLKDLVKRKTK